MLKKDLFNLKNSLDELKNLTGAKFSYVILKNKILIEQEIKILDDVNKQSDNYINFEVERIKLCEKYSEKDENGKSVLYNNFYKIVNQEEFNKEIYTLTENYKEDIERENIRKASFESLLESEVNIEFLKIKIDDVPSNISVGQLDIIKDFLD